MTVGGAHRSLRDTVVDELRRMILAGEIEAGSRMKEESAAELLGVSRLPVREAFRRLEAEGLLQSTPRRGVTVTPPDEQELKVMSAVRVELELIAVDLAVRRRDPAATARLTDWLAAGTEAAERGDEATLQALNRDFHDMICECGGSAYLGRLLQPVRNRVHHLHGGWHANTDQSWSEHSRIVRAVLDGDAPQAVGLMRTHLVSLHG